MDSGSFGPDPLWRRKSLTFRTAVAVVFYVRTLYSYLRESQNYTVDFPEAGGVKSFPSFSSFGNWLPNQIEFQLIRFRVLIRARRPHGVNVWFLGKAGESLDCQRVQYMGGRNDDEENVLFDYSWDDGLRLGADRFDEAILKLPDGRFRIDLVYKWRFCPSPHVKEMHNFAEPSDLGGTSSSGGGELTWKHRLFDLYACPSVEKLLEIGKEDTKLVRVSKWDFKKVKEDILKLSEKFLDTSTVGELLDAVDEASGISDTRRFAVIHGLASSLVDLREGQGAGGKFFIRN